MAATPTRPFRIAVLLSGRGSNFEALVGFVKAQQLPIDFSLVVSDKPSARGLTLAREFGFETAVVPRQAKQLSREAYDQRLVETIAPAAPDLIVLAGFMRVIGHEFIQHFNGNVINIHPSLLPKYQGLHVHQRVLDAGESESGCSVHYVSAEVDAGPLIAQAAVPVLGGDTADTLAARILETEHKLLPSVVRAIAAGTVSRSYLDGVDRTIFADGVEQLIPVKWICRPG